jgi:hypothetical protein
MVVERVIGHEDGGRRVLSGVAVTTAENVPIPAMFRAATRRK